MIECCCFVKCDSVDCSDIFLGTKGILKMFSHIKNMDSTYTYLMVILGLLPLTMILVAVFYTLNNKSLESRTSIMIFRTLGITCLFVSILVLATLRVLSLHDQGVIW